ncbi:MAG TPA: PHP domain-containing protein [Herpetosiphonaceae bacterium]
MMLIDLHTHTIATPHHATWEPDALVRHAKEQGVAVLAVSDHNTTSQVQAALDAGQQHGVHVIPALELDSAFGSKLWHVLIYGIDPANPAIVALAASVFERNARDAQEIAAYFRERGDALPWLETLDRQPTVADVGHALVKAGIVPSQPGVEDEAAGTGWIMTNLRQLYRPVTVDEAIAVTHCEGGLAVLAHPGRSKGVYAIPATVEDVAAMAAAGLDGIEALYSGHSSEQQQFYSELAHRHGLLITAGSDSHHPAQGLRGRPARDCAAFLARFGIAFE